MRGEPTGHPEGERGVGTSKGTRLGDASVFEGPEAAEASDTGCSGDFHQSESNQE